jgi:flagellar biosynthetic protein FlhB
MAEQELDRSEAATPYKLQKARERGQTAKSADVVSVTVFTVAMVFLAWQGAPSWRELFRFDAVLLSQAGRADSPAWLWSLVETMLRAGLKLAVPFFATVVVAALAGNVLQSGVVFSVEPLKPDWSRLNPTTGFKRLFSLQTLFFAARSSLKLSLVSYVVYLALKGLIPHFHTFAGLSPAGSLQALLGGLASLGLEVSLVLGLIAIIDLVYSRRQFAKQMRMSRRELKEEVRHREGDPRIRARLRELRRELLKRSMALRKTREADVLVTNPTHVAVALRYVHGQMPAPKLVAKGAGLLAAVMRQIAARHRIPVVQNPSLARKLFHDLQVEQSVPPALYNQVARIIAWVFAMRDAAAKPKLPGALSAGGAPWRP